MPRRLGWAVPAPRLPFDARFDAFEPVPGPPCAAVDGSHAVLVDNGHHYVVAFRAAAVEWPGAPVFPRIEVVTTTADGAQDDVDALYRAQGLPAPRVRSAEAYGEARRALEEMAACRRAVEALPPEGLLLVDGALEQLPDAPQALADRVVEHARAHDVHVVGVSKRSGISIDGVPVVPVLAMLGKEQVPGRCWSTAVPGHACRIALLHPRARHAFRVDGPKHTLPWLAALARDAVYRGYPYPLAKAHNAVAITQREARRLAERVRREAGADAVWLEDFHMVLDGNAPR